MSLIEQGDFRVISSLKINLVPIDWLSDWGDVAVRATSVGSAVSRAASLRGFMKSWIPKGNPMTLESCHFNSMGDLQEPNDWRYRFHIFLAYFSGLCKGISHWLIVEFNESVGQMTAVRWLSSVWLSAVTAISFTRGVQSFWPTSARFLIRCLVRWFSEVLLAKVFQNIAKHVGNGWKWHKLALWWASLLSGRV